MLKKQNILFFLLFSFITLLYLLFPTANSTNDSYAYAAYVRYGYALLEPFHMLYNVMGFMVHRFLLFSQTDVLATMKAINGIAAVICLLILYKILKEIGTEKIQQLLLIALCAFSFGVWRFATENETYILPIVFSLLGSWFFFKYTQEQSAKTILLTSFWAAFACLFHVIHFFWWVGLFVGVISLSRKVKTAALYLLPSLIVPVLYFITVPLTQHCGLSVNCLWSFFAPTLQSDNVQFSIGADNLYLGVINFCRTFYQVHGNMLFLIKKSLFYIVPALISFILVLLGLIRFFRIRIIVKKPISKFIFTHIIIFALQLIWAFYSKGNAEFMVMLPFLMVIIAAFYFKPDVKSLAYITTSLLIWNLSYGILPNHFADFNKREKLLATIENNNNGIYLLEQGKEIQNQIFYKTGTEDIQNVKKFPKSKVQMDSVFSAAKQSGKEVYTDFYNSTKVINRYSLTNSSNTSYFYYYQYEKIDSFRNFYGMNYIYRIKEK
jgi:hypothetical protein